MSTLMDSLPNSFLILNPKNFCFCLVEVIFSCRVLLSFFRVAGKGKVCIFLWLHYHICFSAFFFLRREELDVTNILNYNQRQLKELKDSKTDRLKRFGPHVPALLEAIDDAYRQGRFAYKPVGPLGDCFDL